MPVPDVATEPRPKGFGRKDLHKRADQRYESPFDLASLYLALGDRESGFKWLANAFRDRCFEVLSIKLDPRFDSLREDSGFAQLIRPLRLH
jgi:hypothetical protein